MSEDEQNVGARRRRREAERAAREAAAQRPLTRREIRAREAALETGAIEIDETGEVRVIADPPPEPTTAATGPDGPGEPPPSEITDTSGLTRRQLRELRERQEAASATSAAEPTPARGVPTPPERVSVKAEPAQPEPAEPEPSTPEASRPEPKQAPPMRRPVVRPPASTGAIRSLAEDGTGLTPVVRDEPPQPKDDPASTGALSAVDGEGGIDVTEVAAPGPLPSTRRSLRVAADHPAGERSESAEPSLDELIAGETDKPEPFDARPSWAELPPPTPSGPIAGLPAPAPAPEGETEVIAAEALRAAEPAPAPSARDERDDDEDDEDEDEHRTPIWLTLLMVLVLVVIGIVLGLLVWRLVQGDDAAAGAAMASLGGLREWLM
ncbi:hypothetical protein [Pseudactinotalea sp.]|uniref:hypothetical protein n=1 Tax=Pseudactinotalea sp. TaxID=1926260 RepID=UPI003B3B2CAE